MNLADGKGMKGAMATSADLGQRLWMGRGEPKKVEEVKKANRNNDLLNFLQVDFKMISAESFGKISQVI